jgi:hypothetical protein
MKPIIDKLTNKMAENPISLAKYFKESDKLEAMNKARVNERSLVPDAPFKKNWHELMMKQILNEAVKGDYDAVAFTTGKQQAERYNLSKQVDQINWMPYESNGSTKVVRIQPLNGNTIELRLSPEGAVMNGGQFADKSIDEVIGKDIAKKIMEENTGDLSGVNLDIGGEPMKKFYDEIIPNFINKYGKKYGMAVKKGNLPYRGIPSADDVYGNAKKYGYSKEQFDKLPLEERMKIADEVKPKGEEVHFVELTDAAKKDIKSKGQPLFSGIGLAPAPLLMGDEEDN